MGNYPFSENSVNVTPAYVLPTGDTSGAADTANIAVAVAKGYMLAPGTFYVKNLTVDTLQSLTGSGQGTVLQAVAGTTGYVVTLAHPATTYQAAVRNLTIVPNTGSLGGVQLDNTGFTSGGGVTDTLHTLEDIYVHMAGGDGFNLGNNVRSLRATRCAAYDSGGMGWNLGSGCTDNFFTSCLTGVSASHGFGVAGGNNMFADCKAFFAGNNGSAFDTTHNGWDISGGYNTLASCQGQTNALHGVNLTGNCNSVMACEFDTNGQGTGSNGVAINVNGAQECTVIGNLGGQIGVETQVFGIQTAGTVTGTVYGFNTVTGTGGFFGYVSGGGYLLVNSNTADFSNLALMKLPSGTFLGGSGSQLYSGSGAPNIPGSPSGSYYFRTDTPGTANQRLYVATGTNTWSGIV
jgi:hypothetical protein